ncbi:MAG: glutathione S-transferase [Gammaproteobacteria bacterium]|nr:glutathione S-transferase [Gammaproteobacteria bacterium]
MPYSTLYSFRRCPYAMRARLAIANCGIKVELREVVLRDKPEELLAISAKATVPVLVTSDENIIDESIDIMFWALQQNDPDGWLSGLSPEQLTLAKQMIAHNDGEFKYYLDRYKYADRYPEHSQQYYRQQAEKTLYVLEQNIMANGYLISAKLSIVDMAILPFIRQLAFVDKAWFDQSPYPLLKRWLEAFLNSELFEKIMSKYPQWHAHDFYTFPSDL